jgi:hypothetical protein
VARALVEQNVSLKAKLAHCIQALDRASELLVSSGWSPSDAAKVFNIDSIGSIRNPPPKMNNKVPAQAAIPQSELRREAVERRSEDQPNSDSQTSMSAFRAQNDLHTSPSHPRSTSPEQRQPTIANQISVDSSSIICGLNGYACVVRSDQRSAFISPSKLQQVIQERFGGEGESRLLTIPQTGIVVIFRKKDAMNEFLRQEALIKKRGWSASRQLFSSLLFSSLLCSAR